MTIAPNAFQSPNIYIDRAMQLLLDSEFRVLVFATRHIMGWQGHIDDREGHISLTMFLNGFTTKTGYVCGPCGLGKGAIVDALSNLVGFGFLERMGEPTDKGQRWKLCDSGIKWDDLEKRQAEKIERKKQQTAKATVASQAKRLGGSTLNVPPSEPSTSNVTMQGEGSTLNVTGGGSLDVLNQSHVESQKNNTSAPIGTGTQTKPETIPVVIDVLAEANKVIEAKAKKERTPDPVFDAVAFHIFGIDPTTVTKETGGRIGPIAQWLKGKSDGLKRAGGKVGFISRAAEPEHVKLFAAWYKSEYPDANLPYDLVKFVESWRKWATVMSKRATVKTAPAPIAAPRELTQAERDELALARQAIRPAWEGVGVK